ncbi:MAG TPA: carbohydrate kinase family protein [Patescibacteria group bacterium]|nr:carbohydrate kinase family protein [Patescibacteria group bacterium]
MQMFDIICVGEAIVDVLVTLSEKGSHYRVEKEKKELTLLLGEKIPVTSSAFSLGGNAAHVAVGFARLGFRAALAVELGVDEFGEKILKELEKEKVNKSLLRQLPDTQTTFNVSVSAGGDRTILVHHIEHEQNFSFANMQSQWIFLTSMGNTWEDAYTKTLDFVKESGAKLAFNPGGTQLRAGIDSFSDVVKMCDILFVNKEEAEEILYKEVLPTEKKENAEALLFRLQRMGPKTVVLTDGQNGAYAIDESSRVFSQKAFPVVVTEKTGAGDGFSAGFIAAIAQGLPVHTALLWGTAEAAGVVTKVGGQEGLLTKQEIENMIQKYS